MKKGPLSRRTTLLKNGVCKSDYLAGHMILVEVFTLLFPNLSPRSPQHHCEIVEGCDMNEKGEDDSSFIHAGKGYIHTHDKGTVHISEIHNWEKKQYFLFSCWTLSLGFVGEWCSASSAFLTDATSSGSMISIHRTACIDTAYIYMLYVLLRGEENVFLHPCHQE